MKKFYIGLGGLLTVLAVVIFLGLHTDEARQGFIIMNGIDTDTLLGEAPATSPILSTALRSLADSNIIPIITTGIGRSERQYRESNGTLGASDEVAYEQDILKAARAAHSPAWLNVRIAPTELESVKTHELTLEAIEKDTSVAAAFYDAFRARIRAYAGPGAPYEHECTVILFEDETPYVPVTLGGKFWTGSNFELNDPVTDMDGYTSIISPRISDKTEASFIESFPRLYRALRTETLNINKSCTVGVYLNSALMRSTLHGERVISALVAKIPDTEQPSYILFRSFNKSYFTQKEFEKRLRSNVNTFVTALHPQTKLIFIGQLHTTNRQGEGAGRLPSQKQLDATVSLARQLPLYGLGYSAIDQHEKGVLKMAEMDDGTERYACVTLHPHDVLMRNTACSPEEDSEPLYPNDLHRRFLYDGRYETHSTKRWDYGIELLRRFMSN